ncbi:MAG: NeuD/PglB/VioB family sugar acetyltransferase [Alphaproteobacteria bacterium]
MTNLIIVGAGGFALEVTAYAEDIAKAGTALTIQGFLDDTKAPGSFHAGYPILGSTDVALDPNAHYIIALGHTKHRATLAAKLGAKNVRWARLVHPLAYVATSATLGAGCIIAPFAFVGPAVTLADQVVVNVHATIGHEARIGACVVLSPYANINGAAQLADGVFVGSAATVVNGITIGTRSKISAGAVVFNDIPPGMLARGNPASHAPA